jgi:Kef-type K+ transport system membrane component KefB
MFWYRILCFTLLASEAYGSTGADHMAQILLGLVLLFTGAKGGGYLAQKFHMPAVLGELFAGVLLGNALLLTGYDGFAFLKEESVFKVFAEIGVLLLLFEVGLESNLSDLLKVGLSAFLAAVVGVVAPFTLGYFVSQFLLPQSSFYVHAFVGATLCATSVGITARVLKDLGKIHLPESKIILGAAVIDDVLGLIVLALVSALIQGAGSGEALSYGSFFMIAGKAIGFLVASILIGVRLAPALFRFGAKLKMEGMLLSLALSFCFLLSYLAHLAGLAPIVGAFAAGLIIDGTGYDHLFGEEEPSLEDLIHPVSKFFVPIFFVSMGMGVDLETFMNPQVLLIGLALSFVAILGKQVCGLAVLGAKEQKLNRLLIGIGMIPRGEVGLIFAMIGSKLVLDGKPVVDASLYSAIVLMVMVTTLITPIGLKWVLDRSH